MAEEAAEAVGAEDKMFKLNKNQLKCPICNEVVYSEIGKGCKMCGMPLENREEIFCCRLCMRKYKTIFKNKIIKIGQIR